MKTGKRIIAILLAAVVALTMLPAGTLRTYAAPGDTGITEEETGIRYDDTAAGNNDTTVRDDKDGIAEDAEQADPDIEEEEEAISFDPDEEGVISCGGNDPAPGDHAPKNISVRLIREETDPDGTTYVVCEVSWDADSSVGMCEMRPFVADDELVSVCEYLLKKGSQSIVREDQADGSVPKEDVYKVQNGKNIYRLRVKKLRPGEAHIYKDDANRLFSNGVNEGDTMFVTVQAVTGDGTIVPNIGDALGEGRAVKVTVTKEGIKGRKTFTEIKDQPEGGCDHFYEFHKKDNDSHEFVCKKCNALYSSGPHIFRKLPAENGSEYYECILCSYNTSEEEDQPVSEADRPAVDTVTWNFNENKFGVNFNVDKALLESVQNEIGQLIVWNGDSANGEPVAEGEITRTDCTVESLSEDRSKVTGDVGVDWKFLDPGDCEKMTVAVKTKKPGGGDGPEVLSDPVTLDRNEKYVKVPEGKAFTFDGQEHQGVEEGPGYTLTGLYRMISKGAYLVAADLDEGYRWNDGGNGRRLIWWGINPATITSVELSAYDFAYKEGTVQKPTVIAVKGDSVYAGPDEYTVTYSNENSTNKGTYTVTVTGKGNFQGTATATYTIGDDIKRAVYDKDGKRIIITLLVEGSSFGKDEDGRLYLLERGGNGEAIRIDNTDWTKLLDAPVKKDNTENTFWNGDPAGDGPMKVTIVRDTGEFSDTLKEKLDNGEVYVSVEMEKNKPMRAVEIEKKPPTECPHNGDKFYTKSAYATDHTHEIRCSLCYAKLGDEDCNRLGIDGKKGRAADPKCSKHVIYCTVCTKTQAEEDCTVPADGWKTDGGRDKKGYDIALEGGVHTGTCSVCKEQVTADHRFEEYFTDGGMFGKCKSRCEVCKGTATFLNHDYRVTGEEEKNHLVKCRRCGYDSKQPHVYSIKKGIYENATKHYVICEAEGCNHKESYSHVWGSRTLVRYWQGLGTGFRTYYLLMKENCHECPATRTGVLKYKLSWEQWRTGAFEQLLKELKEDPHKFVYWRHANKNYKERVINEIQDYYGKFDKKLPSWIRYSGLVDFARTYLGVNKMSEYNYSKQRWGMLWGADALTERVRFESHTGVDLGEKEMTQGMVMAYMFVDMQELSNGKLESLSWYESDPDKKTSAKSGGKQVNNDHAGAPEADGSGEVLPVGEGEEENEAEDDGDLLAGYDIPEGAPYVAMPLDTLNIVAIDKYSPTMQNLSEGKHIFTVVMVNGDPSLPLKEATATYALAYEFEIRDAKDAEGNDIYETATVYNPVTEEFEEKEVKVRETTPLIQITDEEHYDEVVEELTENGILPDLADQNDATVAIQGGPFVYNGSAYTPEVEVTYGGSVLDGSEYTVEYVDNEDAGTAYVFVTGKEENTSGFNGIAEASFEIAHAEATITLSLTDQTKAFTGEWIGMEDFEGALTVTGEAPEGYADSVYYEYYSDEECKDPADPLYAGTYYVVASASPEDINHKAPLSNTATLTITPAEGKFLAEMTESVYQFTGDSIEPDEDITVYASDGTELTPGTHYTLEYENNTEIGTAFVTVKGKADSAYEGFSQTLSFEITGDESGLKLSASRLMIAVGDTAYLALSGITSEEYAETEWAIEDADGEAGFDVATYDPSTHLVTTMTTGTVWVVAELDGRSVRCRVDVYDPDSLDITGVRLEQTKTTVQLYSTNYAEVPVFINMKQEEPAPVGAVAGLSDNGVLIEAASFENAATEEAFDLVIRDDATLLIVPDEEYVEGDAAKLKKLKKTYKSKIRLTVRGTDCLTDALTITLKKNKPAIKAGKVSFNSSIDAEGVKDTKEIRFTGGKVLTAELSGDSNPAWAVFDEENMTLKYAGEKDAKMNGTVKLLVTVEGWAPKLPVSVKVSASKVVPKIRLSAKNVTLNPNTGDCAQAKVTISPDLYKDEIPEITITENGKAVENGTKLRCVYTNGNLRVYCGNEFDDAKAHTFKVTVKLGDGKATLTVKTLAAAKKPGIKVKGSGKINTKIAKSPFTLNVTPVNYNKAALLETKVRIVRFKKSTKEETDVTDLFNIDEIGSKIILTEKTPESLTAGYAYYAYVKGITGSGVETKETKTEIKVTRPSKAPAPSVSVKVKGSLDCIRPGSTITIRPAVKDYYDYEFTEEDLIIYTGQGWTATPAGNGAENDWFDVEWTGSVFVLGLKENIADEKKIDHLKDKFSVGLRITDRSGESPVIIKEQKSPSKISITMGKVKFSQSKKAVTLSSKDNYDRKTVQIGVLSADVSKIDHVEIASPKDKKTKRAYYSLRDLGGGQYAICYNGHQASGVKAGTVSLRVYLKGNNTAGTSKAKPNAVLKVKVSLR